VCSEEGGDGTKTFFWIDTCVDRTPLCVRIQCLFDLAVNKLSTMAELFSLRWGIRGEAWK
jgi:hypothetical protein